MVKQEWTPEDITDFLSDFAGVTDDHSIFKKAKEVYQEKLDAGWNERDANNYADGYAQALLDIYNQK
jgi:hypothetical protein